MSGQLGDGLEQYTESDSDRPGDAIESGMRETVAHPGIDGTWHHYGNIEWWEPDQLYDSDYARPICPVKHCASGRDHECRTICTRINPDGELKSEFVLTDNPVSGGWFCTHHCWFRIHDYPRETESESEQATLVTDGGREQSTEEVNREYRCQGCGELAGEEKITFVKAAANREVRYCTRCQRVRDHFNILAEDHPQYRLMEVADEIVEADRAE